MVARRKRLRQGAGAARSSWEGRRRRAAAQAAREAARQARSLFSSRARQEEARLAKAHEDTMAEHAAALARSEADAAHHIAFAQVGGFQGRPNKDEDTCYSFWIGATLALLGEAAAPEAAASAAAAAAAAPPPPRPPALAAGAARLSDPAALAAFSLRCECAPYGGFAKCVGNHPDVLHSYFALCGLAIVGAPGLRPLDCRLGMTKRAAAAAGLRDAEPEAVECE